MTRPSRLQEIFSWLGHMFVRTKTRIGTLHRRRVPVILQPNIVECGATCLAMIISYYGRSTRMTDYRECFNSGRNGTSAQAIAQMARKFGFHVNAYSIKNLADFKYIQLPAIVHWEFNHFIVVECWSPKKVQVVDPASGRRDLTADEFDTGFTGVVLTFRPDIQYEKQHTKSQAAWQSYLKYLLNCPGIPSLLAQILSASLLLQVFGLALPVFTKILVDQVIPFGVSNVMAVIGIGMLILILAQTVTMYLRSALLIYLQGHLDSRVMIGFFEHLLALPFRFFQARTSGDLLMRLNSNVIIREILTSQVTSTILDGVLVLVYLVILLTQNALFGILVLTIGMLQIAILLSTTRPVRRLTAESLITQAASQSYLVETLRGIATLKVTGAEDRSLERWSHLFFKQLNVSLQQSHLSAVIGAAMMTLRTLSPIMLLWFGAYRVLAGDMSLGTMLALNTLAASVLTPLASLMASGQQLQLVGAHLERISDVMETESEQDLLQEHHTPHLTGRIEIQHIHFRYHPDAPLILDDISVAIQAGQKIALVGRTGAGKTTLGMLLLRLYMPTEGKILYDGIPLQNFNYQVLRRQFGVVLQSPYLFSGSIRKNITLNDPDISMEQVTHAARLAMIHDEILKMPMGYETIIAEGGSVLSGGQRQRIVLASALVRNPPILLLDEATSDLDELTERLVDKNLSQLSCTRIVIAHRLSTVCNANLILAFDQGKIIEQGTHEELLARNGYYAELVSHQLKTNNQVNLSIATNAEA